MIIYEPPQFIFNDMPFFPEWTQEGNVSSVSEDGKPVLLQLNLGLFSNLSRPLSDKDQFDALEESLKTFTAEAVANHNDKILGVEIYRGTLEDVLSFPWNEQQQDNFIAWKASVDPCDRLAPGFLKQHYASYMLNEFVDLLTSGIPIQVEWFAKVDAGSILDEMNFYLMSNPARYDHLHIFWKAPKDTSKANLIWEKGIPMLGYTAERNKKISYLEDISLGWCLPPVWNLDPEKQQEQQHVLAWLEENNIEHRPIPLEKISLYWQGLDTIIAFSSQATVQSRRQLAGFCAAGGTVVAVGGPIGLANEISFESFRSQYV